MNNKALYMIAAMSAATMAISEAEQPHSYQEHRPRKSRAGYTRKSRRMMLRTTIKAQRKAERQRRGK